MSSSKEIHKKNRLEREDYLICYSIFSNFVILSLQYLILISFSLLGTAIGSNIQMALKAIIFLCYLRALPIVLKRRLKTSIFTLMIVCLVCLWSITFFPQNTSYFKDYFITLVLVSMPTFLYMYSVNDLRIFKKVMKKSSFIVLVTSGGLGILALFKVVSVGMYSMTLSYYLLFPAIVFFNEYSKEKKIVDLLISLFCLLLIIIFGSRGPLFSLFTFIIMRYFFSENKKNYQFYINRLFVISGFLAITFFFSDIVIWLYDYFLSHGIDSRTLYLMTLDNIHMSGRETIYSELIGFIKHSPLVGYGLAGDIFLLDGYGFAHNIIIEIFLNFGVFIGGSIIVVIILLVGKGLKTYSYLNTELTLMFFSLGFVHLMVSGSYLIDFKFWIFIALILNINRNQRRRELGH